MRSNFMSGQMVFLTALISRRVRWVELHLRKQSISHRGQVLAPRHQTVLNPRAFLIQAKTERTDVLLKHRK